jgi:hypothetical protein
MFPVAQQLPFLTGTGCACASLQELLLGFLSEFAAKITACRLALLQAQIAGQSAAAAGGTHAQTYALPCSAAAAHTSKSR